MFTWVRDDGYGDGHNAMAGTGAVGMGTGSHGYREVRDYGYRYKIFVSGLVIVWVWERVLQVCQVGAP